MVVEKPQSIKLEIGLRFNPYLPVSKKKVGHTFLHPFTKEPLFDAGSVNCFALKELVAEKLRGRPIDKKIEAAVNGIGFALLVGLMIYVTIKDITKFFTV